MRIVRAKFLPLMRRKIRNKQPPTTIQHTGGLCYHQFRLLRIMQHLMQNHGVGGTILQWLLAGFAGHFNERDPVAMRYLDELMRLEDLLVDSGDLASDFVVVVAKPR